MAQAPTEVVLEAGVPSCFIRGEGPSPALSPPPPCERRSSNSGAQVAPRPWGIILSVSHEEREIPPPRAPGQHTPPPAEGADARSPGVIRGRGPFSPRAGAQGSRGDALQPAAPRLRRWAGARAPSEGMKAEPSVPPRGPCVPLPSPPTASFLPRPFSLAVVVV